MSMALALVTNIRLGWKQKEVANALAYYNTVTIVAVKSFIVQAPGLQIIILVISLYPEATQ
jgi:hypothetical protein